MTEDDDFVAVRNVDAFVDGPAATNAILLRPRLIFLPAHFCVTLLVLVPAAATAADAFISTSVSADGSK